MLISICKSFYIICFYTEVLLPSFNILLQNVKTGELIIGAVINRTASGMMLKVLCTSGPTSRYVADINVKVLHNVLKLDPKINTVLL